MKNQRELFLEGERKESRPLFSIITVSFNSRKTIERTIKSILSQTEDNYEYWIIDGGSTDGTMDVVLRYQTFFNGRLNFISEPDSGIYNAMNKGIMLALGDIIGIVNSDDWLESDALENICYALEKAKSFDNSIYCGWMYFHYMNGKVGLLKTNEKRVNSYYSKLKMGVRHPATFVPAAIYERVGKFDESLEIMADQDFIIRCLNNNVRLFFIDKALTHMSDGGVSNNSRYKKQLRKDLKYYYSKHTTSRIWYWMYVSKDILVMCVKGIVPQRLVRVIRNDSID